MTTRAGALPPVVGAEWVPRACWQRRGRAVLLKGGRTTKPAGASVDKGGRAARWQRPQLRRVQRSWRPRSFAFHFGAGRRPLRAKTPRIFRDLPSPAFRAEGVRRRMVERAASVARPSSFDLNERRMAFQWPAVRCRQPCTLQWVPIGSTPRP